MTNTIISLQKKTALNSNANFEPSYFIPCQKLNLAHNVLGRVAPISVNFNHQLAYFADHSDTTHVRHQPTAVA